MSIERLRIAAALAALLFGSHAGAAVPALEELQVAEARSGLPVVGGDLLAQNDPVRGVGGLAARPGQAALGGTRMGTWLEDLRQRVAGLEVQRVELINP